MPTAAEALAADQQVAPVEVARKAAGPWGLALAEATMEAGSMAAVEAVAMMAAAYRAAETSEVEVKVVARAVLLAAVARAGEVQCRTGRPARATTAAGQWRNCATQSALADSLPSWRATPSLQRRSPEQTHPRRQL